MTVRVLGDGRGARCCIGASRSAVCRVPRASCFVAHCASSVAARCRIGQRSGPRCGAWVWSVPSRCGAVRTGQHSCARALTAVAAAGAADVSCAGAPAVRPHRSRTCFVRRPGERRVFCSVSRQRSPARVRSRWRCVVRWEARRTVFARRCPWRRSSGAAPSIVRAAAVPRGPHRRVAPRQSARGGRRGAGASSAQSGQSAPNGGCCRQCGPPFSRPAASRGRIAAEPDR